MSKFQENTSSLNERMLHFLHMQSAARMRALFIESLVALLLCGSIAYLAPFAAFASSTLGHSILTAPPNDLGLVGYWPLDGSTINWKTGTAQDMSGDGKTGVLKNLSTTTSPVAGEIGQALRFNGSNQYIATNSYVNDPESTNALTFSAWFKSSSSNTQQIFNNVASGTANSSGGYSLSLNSRGQVQFLTTNLTNPVALNALSPAIGAGSYHSAVSGHYLYLTDYEQVSGWHTGNLEVYNLSDPTNLISIYASTEKDLLSGIVIKGSYAYIADDTNHNIRVVDILNPSNPVAVGHSTASTSAATLRVSGDYLYALDPVKQSMDIYSLASSTDPTLESSVSLGAVPSSLIVSGNYAYVTSGHDSGGTSTGTLKVIDVSDSANPTVVGTLSVNLRATIAYGGNYDIYTENFDDMALSGNYLYIVGTYGWELQVIDISDPSNPTSVFDSQTILSAENVGVTALIAAGSRLYAIVGNYQSGGLIILNISNPISPVAIATYISGGTITDGIFYDGYIYETGNENLNTLKVPTGPLGPFVSITTPLSYDDGQWHSIIATKWDDASNTGAIYIDGKEATSGPMGQIIGSVADMSLGAVSSCANSCGADTQTFNGSLDDLRIYDRAFSPSEALQSYHAEEGSHIDPSLGTTTFDKTFTPPNLQTGLIGHWTFDGTDMNWQTGKALDSSGQGNTGSLIGMSTSTSPAIGKIGQALSFNGTSQYVKLTDASLDPGTGDGYSLCTWVKTTAVEGPIISLRDSGSYYTIFGFYLGSDGINPYPDDVIFTVRNDNEAGTAELVGPDISTGEWTFLCGTETPSGSLALYVNGALTKTGSHAMYLKVFNDSAIGADLPWIQTSFSGVRYFKGSLDDVRTYDRALSASEVKELYDLGK